MERRGEKKWGASKAVANLPNVRLQAGHWCALSVTSLSVWPPNRLSVVCVFLADEREEKRAMEKNGKEMGEEKKKSNSSTQSRKGKNPRGINHSSECGVDDNKNSLFPLLKHEQTITN